MPGKGKSTKPNKYTLGKKKASTDGLFDVDLPSGETCQAKRPGVPGLIELGLLDSFDDLTAFVQIEHIDPKTARGQKVSPEQARDAAIAIMKDPDKLAKMLHLVDRVVVGIVTQPIVWIDYQQKDESDEAWEKRQAKAQEDEAVAVRDIDLDDKMFLLNWAVGGTSDLKAFRQGSQELMGNLAASEAV